MFHALVISLYPVSYHFEVPTAQFLPVFNIDILLFGLEIEAE